MSDSSAISKSILENGWLALFYVVIVIMKTTINNIYEHARNISKNCWCVGKWDFWCLYKYINIYVCDPTKKIEWHFNGRLTFLNIRGRLLVELVDQLYHFML